ncbi:MAG: ABC transporter ATP-binding protein [Acidimicrobiales bacterium]
MTVPPPMPPPTLPPAEPLLAIEDLRVQFRTDQGVVKAVDGVTFSVWPDEVLGIVGESGSGKTVTALSVLGLLPPTARVTGTVSFKGRDMLAAPASDLRAVRGGGIAVIFQDALAALNPLHRVGKQVAEAIRIHQPDVSRSEADRRAVELLGMVGIPSPTERAHQFPHEFSGGMRQRVMIAMAMANDPEVLIADEPTTALDVTTQAQVLELLQDVHRRTHSALILITHDVGVVAGVADRVVVMYAGKAVESGTVEQVLLEPAHPYTRGLLASMPRLEQEGGQLTRIGGQPPSLIDVPSGCAFHPRCASAALPEPCATAAPEFRPVCGVATHWAACHFAEQLLEVGAGSGGSSPA